LATARSVEPVSVARPRSSAAVVDLDGHDLDPAAGEDLHDAGAHGAEADHAHLVDLARHRCILPGGLSRESAMSRGRGGSLVTHCTTRE
jgi:hypothetical protein